jgi:hypothetical protein
MHVLLIGILSFWSWGYGGRFDRPAPNRDRAAARADTAVTDQTPVKPFHVDDGGTGLPPPPPKP